jgi:mannonate dehydratase
MKLGLGLYRNMLKEENYRFARQAGATHIVAHLVDYFNEGPRLPHARHDGWGVVKPQDALWTVEGLAELKANIEAHDLKLEAIENFDPTYWHDILLDGPRRDLQIEKIKTIIRNLGEVGIPVMGYNFSIAGVWGHVTGPFGRGGAESVGFFGPDGPEETPIPNGMVWNMVYDPEAPVGTIASVTHEELWDRLTRFLQEIIPVAEEAGVKMAAHPDDPPMPTIRGTARLVYQPDYYQKLLDIQPSPSNTMEFCIGSLAEMSEGDIYDVIDRYSKQNKIGYIHMRNVRGKVPHYEEVFIDEGDVDMLRVLRILHENGYEGVLIPDHTPRMECDAPWHAGMAYALGFMKAGLMMIGAV